MEEERTEKDMIDSLPDAILHQILSFVPTKSVLMTQAVSRRWREIATEHLSYANNLDFGEDFSKGKTPDVFTENIIRILSVNNSDKIDKFRLLFSPRNEQHKNNAIDWIKFVISKGVRDIDLDFCRHIRHHLLSQAHVVNRDEAFEIPGFLFDSKSLVNVKLSRCILSLPEKYTGFGKVQTLHLRKVHVTDDMLEILLGNCPLLEVLVLKEIGSLSKIRIQTSAYLKRLTVYECYNASVLKISGPNLRSLLISSGHLDSCNLKDMLKLEEVFIGTRGDEFGGVLYIFMKVLSHLSHVRALTLYLGHLVPSLIKGFQVKFWNLQELQLVNSPLFGLFNSDVYCFFTHCICPSLQKISIELSTVSEEENFIWEYRKPNIEPAECIFIKLKLVELRNFRGTSSDIELASFFLDRAPVLESMLLIEPQNSSSNPSTKKSTTRNRAPSSMPKDLIEALLHRPMASSRVEIRAIESKEHENLLSFFKWHRVFDVYHK